MSTTTQELDTELLSKATSDTAFAKTLVDSPGTAIAEVTGRAPHQVVASQAQRDLLRVALQKASGDETFRQALISNPSQAMSESDLAGQYQEVTQRLAAAKQAETQGDMPCWWHSACVCYCGSTIGVDL